MLPLCFIFHNWQSSFDDITFKRFMDDFGENYIHGDIY